MLLEAQVSEASIKPATEYKVLNLHLMNVRLICLEPRLGLTFVKKTFFNTTAYKYGDALHDFDQLIWLTLSQITIVGINERSCSQALLPDRFDELGLRRAVDDSLLAYASYVHATRSLVDPV